MKRLAVIDLDKTLLRIDSSRYFLVRYAFSSLVFLGTLRKLNIISREFLAKSIVKRVDALPETVIYEFVHSLVKFLNMIILEEINRLKNSGTEVIILSGSADKYVSLLGKQIGIQGFGSKFDEHGGFLYLYGKEKADFLQKNFKSHKYYYTISDSISDKPLFEIFEQPHIFSKNKVTKL